MKTVGNLDGTYLKPLKTAILLVVLGLFGLAPDARAQLCDDLVPYFDVDLTADAQMTYFSPAVQREGNCCGTTAPDNCIAFSITLHPDAVGIIFDICDGAIPPGAMYYQVECGTAAQVGDVLCLNGAGPHLITFCKPGNNTNVYCITSVPMPSAGADQTATDGCNAVLSTQGFDPLTIQWTSVYPGPEGLYNGTMSCLNCPSVTVTAPAVFPAYIDYEVCGQPLGGCEETPFCDTVRVYFASSLAVVVDPLNPAICFGSPGIDVSALATGGFPPYILNWSTGETGPDVFITQGGSYSVTVSDSTGCPPATFNFTVSEYSLPVSVNAGPDQVVCDDITSIQLSGSYTGSVVPVWQGGGGVYVNGSNSPVTGYIPSATELSTGVIELTLGIYPPNDCPVVTDEVTILLQTPAMDFPTTVTQVNCFGQNNGAINIDLGADAGDFLVNWNTGQTGAALSGLSPGTYDAVITSSIGCVEDYSFTITQPQQLSVAISNYSNPTCYNGTNGTITAQATGGIQPYSYIWNPGQISGSQINNLPDGNYTVTVTDANGCTSNASQILTEPGLITVNAGADQIVCDDVEGVQLNGSFTGNSIPVWEGGSGTFVSGINSPQTLYLPTSTEVAAGVLTLTLAVYPPGGCPVVSDQVTIQFQTPSMDFDSVVEDISCNGMNDGSISIELAPNENSFTILWSTGQGGESIAGLAPGNYSATITSLLGCQEVMNFTITQPAPLVVTVPQVSDPLCTGDFNGGAAASVAGGTAPYSYLWSYGNNSGSVIAGMPAGTYAVTVMDDNGCMDSESFVLQDPDPLVIDATDDLQVCTNDLFTIQAFPQGGTGGYEYHWSNTGLNLAAQQMNLFESEVFTVYVTDANGCQSNLADIEVDVILMDPGLLTVEGGGDLCAGESTEILANYSGEYGPYLYNWNNNLPDAPGPHIVSPAASTTYTLVVSDQCNNQVEVEVPVTIQPIPVISLPEVLGSGCAPLTIQLYDSGNTSFGDSHVWTINGVQTVNGNGLFYEFSEPGLHEVSVVVTSAAGCQSLMTDEVCYVNVEETPMADFTASAWVTVISEPEIQFTSTSSSDVVALKWEIEDSVIEDVFNPTHVFTEVGYFPATLIVWNQAGCTDTTLRNVEVKPLYEIVVPNGFTPTDMVGGYYDPTSTNNNIFYPFADYVDKFRMSIFNRWGELVFETEDLAYGWDGYYRGVPCQQDVYVYKIEVTFLDGFRLTKVGDVTLFR